MIVKCVQNDVSLIGLEAVKSRLQSYIHLDGPDSYLEINQYYPVQAIENRGGGFWFYLHTVEDNEYPFPYPAEFFSIQDSSLPDDWQAKLTEENGNLVLKRISFQEWTKDDNFYEKLIGEFSEYIQIYLNKKRT